MATETLCVHVVAQDPATGRAIVELVEGDGHVVELWPSVAAFLAAAGGIARGCVVIDSHAADLDAAFVHQRLASPDIGLPSVVVTASPDLESAVAAMRHGAIDVLTTPVDPHRLSGAIAIAGRRLAKARQRAATIRRVNAALDILSVREREVLDGLTRGWSNKEIARRLSISARTVEIHRANVMEKLNAESLSQALRIAFISQVCGLVNPALHVD